MRQPCVRFTVRGMIFAVGIVGTVIGTVQMISRWGHYRIRAQECDRLAVFYRKEADESDTKKGYLKAMSRDMKFALARYYEDERNMYQEAEWHPWRSLPRSSPPPDWQPDRLIPQANDDW